MGQIIVRVSVSGLMGSNMTVREVVPPKKLPEDVVRLRGDAGQKDTPAIIGLRTDLSVGVNDRGDTVHQWHVSLSPDMDAVRRRCLVEPGTIIHDGTGGLRGRHASYNIVHALEDAHEQVSGLDSPDPLDGTTMQMWLGFRRDGSEFVEMSISSLAGLKRRAKQAEETNEMRRREAYRIKIFFWTLWEQDYERVPVPSIPRNDEWKTFHLEALRTLLLRSFAPPLRSLWKAAFGDEVLSRVSEFPADRVQKTFFSDARLRDIIAQQDRPERRTMLFNPDEHKLPPEEAE